MIRIKYGKCFHILEYGCRFIKGYTMFALIFISLYGIPLEIVIYGHFYIYPKNIMIIQVPNLQFRVKKKFVSETR